MPGCVAYNSAGIRLIAEDEQEIEHTSDVPSELHSSKAVAPILIRHGTTSVSQVAVNAELLLSAGLHQWQVEAILAASSQATAGSQVEGQEAERRDLPVRQFNKRASLQAALEAAQPNENVYGGVQSLGAAGVSTRRQQCQGVCRLLESRGVQICSSVLSGNLLSPATESEDAHPSDGEDHHT
eukprot:s893_g4.t1